jgi:hypothetical protein
MTGACHHSQFFSIEMESPKHFFPWAGLELQSSYLSLLRNLDDSPCHHIKLLVEMGSHKFFLPGLASNHDHSQLASQIARITGMSHWYLALLRHLLVVSPGAVTCPVWISNSSPVRGYVSSHPVDWLWGSMHYKEYIFSKWQLSSYLEETKKLVSTATL